MGDETTQATLLAYGMIAGAAFVIERAHATAAPGETGQRIDDAAARIWRAFQGDESLVDIEVRRLRGRE